MAVPTTAANLLVPNKVAGAINAEMHSSKREFGSAHHHRRQRQLHLHKRQKDQTDNNVNVHALSFFTE